MMFYKYGILISVGILLFCGGYLLADRKSKITEQTMEANYTETVKANLDEYNKTIERYKSQITWLQQNNITTVKTVYLPSGKKIVTKIVDKTIEKKSEAVTQNKTQEDKKVAVISSEQSQNVIETKKVEVSLSAYKVGILTSTNNFSDFSLSSGVRLSSLPIFITAQVPVSDSFYKKVSIGAEFEF